MYKHLLVPTDGSPLSLKAAKAAAGLAKKLDARITALHVTSRWIPPLGSEGAVASQMAELEEAYRRSSETAGGKALGQVARLATAAGVKCERVRVTGDQPWDAIIRAAAKHKCDLVVMASHGRRGIAGLLLGSETTKVLTHSKVPVLVCR
jgi:nucleotide-binding universal stress UspA family protein